MLRRWILCCPGSPDRRTRPETAGWHEEEYELLAALSTDQKIQLALGNFAALASFGVPGLNADDGPDGIRNPGTTAMPSGQALAATFDRALASGLRAGGGV